MYIQINDKKYSCAGYNPTINSVIFSGVENLTLPITGTVILCDNDGFELAVQDCAEFARQTYENGLLKLTNEPGPAAPTIAELQAAAESQSDQSQRSRCSRKFWQQRGILCGRW